MNCFVVRGGLAEPRGVRDGIHKRCCEGKLSDRLLEWCYLDASGYRVKSWLGNASAFGFAVNETVRARVTALHYFTFCILHSHMGYNELLQADEITGWYIFQLGDARPHDHRFQQTALAESPGSMPSEHERIRPRLEIIRLDNNNALINGRPEWKGGPLWR